MAAGAIIGFIMGIIGALDPMVDGQLYLDYDYGMLYEGYAHVETGSFELDYEREGFAYYSSWPADEYELRVVF